MICLNCLTTSTELLSTYKDNFPNSNNTIKVDLLEEVNTTDDDWQTI